IFSSSNNGNLFIFMALVVTKILLATIAKAENGLQQPAIASHDTGRRL
ncbi:MAG: hypothetical protein IPG80_15495, partial [Anaerolineales bacterium]|nr:hypothetical protein [Anaerolineales bacterium]